MSATVRNSLDRLGTPQSRYRSRSAALERPDLDAGAARIVWRAVNIVWNSEQRPPRH
jgi:hypothetical protein